MQSSTRTLPTVRFRAIEPEDLEFLYSLENDAHVWNVGVTNVPYSRYVLTEFIVSSSADIYADKQVRLMVENEEGVAVGMADVMNFSPEHRRAEVGILVGETFRRRGYAKAILSKLSEYALRTLRLHQLYAIVDAENEVALRLFEMSGFMRESILKQWLFDGKNYHNAVLMQKIL